MRDLLIPVGVVLVIASMLFPVPPGIMDFLLVSNLLLAFVLLVSALYISEPLKLSSLPSILLLATLYRLALNISTTRLILSSGEAGQAVEAFGNVVIQGNLIVGVVVFLIITLVQFIVIAKGSERVAEVSARFTLDALPGKQMSIDADVRAGLIDFETARQKRQELQTESRFYGALDGAMKFVKGDAIAGLIITAINIIGGLAIGILVEGLDVGLAAQKYSLLTVGDGLLSQVPALLNSLCAGMVVTRVTRGDGASLTREVAGQVLQLTGVRTIIGVLSLVLAMIPGMPKLPFILLGILLIAGGVFKSSVATDSSKAQPTAFKPRPTPLLLFELSQTLAQKLHTSGLLSEKVEIMRQRIYEERGLILPRPEFAVVKERAQGFRIRMRGVHAGASKEEQGDAAAILDEMATHVNALLTERTGEFVDDMLTRRTLDFFDKESPELVSAVVPGVITLTQLTEILKELAKEGISIRNFDCILQAVAESGPKAANDRALLEDVRIALRRVICEKYAGEELSMRCIMLDPVVDLACVRAEKEGVVLDTDMLLEIGDLIHEVLKTSSETISALVVSRGSRRLVRDFLRMRGIEIPVMAHEEVVPQLKLTVAKTIASPHRDRRERVVDALVA